MSDSRSEFIEAVKAQAFDAGQECPTCHGEGVVFPGRRIVHCQAGAFGADWDEDAVVGLIRDADEVRWTNRGLLGDHQLSVRVEGRWRLFQVKRPAEVAS